MISQTKAGSTANPWLILLVLCMGFFMILLDTTIVNIAIPSIINALGASLDQILWVLNAYILVYAVLLITAGRLGDMFGQRNMFALGLTIFTLASAACGIAQTTEQLTIARVVQGIGGALLTPQTMALITTIFPPERRGTAFGIWGAVAGVAAIAGPTLGGLIVTDWNWRWIFYVNVPVGIIALIATFVIIPDLRAGRSHHLDLQGVILASMGLFGIIFGLIEGQRYNWGTIGGGVTIWEIIVAGVVMLVGFVLWERVQDEPLIPLSLFTNRNFTLMNWITATMSFGMLGLFFPITIYLQSALGMTALNAGLTVAPMSLISMFVAPVAGRMVDRIGGRFILMAGLSLFGLGMGIIAWSASGTSTWITFLPAFLIAGLGMGCTFAPLSTVAMRDIEPRRAGAASGLLNTTRQLGGVIGSAVVGAVLQNRLAAALQNQAVSRAASLPPQIPAAVRQQFINAFATTSASGLQVGSANRSGGHIPPGMPPQVVVAVTRFFHDVFLYGYLSAMRSTLAVPIGLVFIGAVSCLAIRTIKNAPAATDVPSGYVPPRAGTRAATEQS